MSGPTGVDLLALCGIAKAYGVPRDARFYELVKVCEEEALRVTREKAKKKKEGDEGDEGECSEAEQRMCREQFGEHFEWACKNCKKKRQQVTEEGDA